MNTVIVKNNVQYFKLKFDILEYKFGLEYNMKFRLINNAIKRMGNL